MTIYKNKLVQTENTFANASSTLLCSLKSNVWRKSSVTMINLRRQLASLEFSRVNPLRAFMLMLQWHFQSDHLGRAGVVFSRTSRHQPGFASNFNWQFTIYTPINHKRTKKCRTWRGKIMFARTELEREFLINGWRWLSVELISGSYLMKAPAQMLLFNRHEAVLNFKQHFVSHSVPVSRFSRPITKLFIIARFVHVSNLFAIH